LHASILIIVFILYIFSLFPCREALLSIVFEVNDSLASTPERSSRQGLSTMTRSETLVVRIGAVGFVQTAICRRIFLIQTAGKITQIASSVGLKRGRVNLDINQPLGLQATQSTP
jgi:hypothetical protein